METICNDLLQPQNKDFIQTRNLRNLKERVGRLLGRRSITITEYDPTYKVVYLGNVLTGWAKGESYAEKPLNTLWKNHTTTSKPDVPMKLLLSQSGLKAITKEHGLTEYWSHRITYCAAPPDLPKLFCWVYRHEGRKLKQELRFHAVLCSKESHARQIAAQLKARIAQALIEFKRDKICRQNARLSLANAVYENPSLPRRKLLLSTGSHNYRPPLERSKSAPKLMAIEESVEEDGVEDGEEGAGYCLQHASGLPSCAGGRRNLYKRSMSTMSGRGVAGTSSVPLSPYRTVNFLRLRCQSTLDSLLTASASLRSPRRTSGHQKKKSAFKIDLQQERLTGGNTATYEGRIKYLPAEETAEEEIKDGEEEAIGGNVDENPFGSDLMEELEKCLNLSREGRLETDVIKDETRCPIKDINENIDHDAAGISTLTETLICSSFPSPQPPDWEHRSSFIHKQTEETMNKSDCSSSTPPPCQESTLVHFLLNYSENRHRRRPDSLDMGNSIAPIPGSSPITCSKSSSATFLVDDGDSTPSLQSISSCSDSSSSVRESRLEFTSGCGFHSTWKEEKEEDSDESGFVEAVG